MDLEEAYQVADKLTVVFNAYYSYQDIHLRGHSVDFVIVKTDRSYSNEKGVGDSALQYGEGSSPSRMTGDSWEKGVPYNTISYRNPGNSTESTLSFYTLDAWVPEF